MMMIMMQLKVCTKEALTPVLSHLNASAEVVATNAAVVVDSDSLLWHTS